MAILWDFFSVFPANAGMILRVLRRHEGRAGVPRECGDDPHWLFLRILFLLCSPRMRG